MIVPMLKEDYENSSIEELVKIQQEIMHEIIDFENKYILKENISMLDDDEEVIEEPGPTVRWRVATDDLIMISKLLGEKTRDEKGNVMDFDY